MSYQVCSIWCKCLLLILSSQLGAGDHFTRSAKHALNGEELETKGKAELHRLSSLIYMKLFLIICLVQWKDWHITFQYCKLGWFGKILVWYYSGTPQNRNSLETKQLARSRIFSYFHCIKIEIENNECMFILIEMIVFKHVICPNTLNMKG